MSRWNGNPIEAKLNFENGNCPIWKTLNKLFFDLNIDYKLADDYEITETGLFVEGGVNILDKNNNILDFGVDSFSDGEKAIFSLAIAGAKSKMEGVMPQVLLLDEYDATFNPSLTEAFYKIVLEFFVKEGVIVILTTHNPITATFAPNVEGYDTTFYEMYKESENPLRIVKKTSEELQKIDEIQKVLKGFYPQVEELKKENERLVKLKKDSDIKIKSLTKPLIVTEGKTDWEHCLSALKLYYHPNEEYQIITEELFWKYTDGFGGDTKLRAWLIDIENSNPSHKIIGIYDDDNSEIKVSDLKDGSRNVHSFKIPVSSKNPYKRKSGEFCIEMLYSDKQIKTSVVFTDGIEKRLYLSNEFNIKQKSKGKNCIKGSRKNKIYYSKDLNEEKLSVFEDSVLDLDGTNFALPKSDFAKAIYNGKITISDKSWENFRPIFEIIKSIIEGSTNPNT